jgi:hypothetical protein
MTAPVNPLTATGSPELVLEPFPSCPNSLPPQHSTPPLVETAQSWISLPVLSLVELLTPAEIIAVPLSPETAAGRSDAFPEPLPSSPTLLSPQQSAVPPSTNAHT